MSEKEVRQKKEARAVIKYLRISPRKVRLVINTIRYKPVSAALSLLHFMNKKAARIVEQGLKSAFANAKGKGFDAARLVVSEAKADGGPVLKRFMSRSMGRADQILKRTTHLTLVLREGEKVFELPPSLEEGKTEKKEKPKKAQAAGKTKAKETAAAGA